MRFTCYDNNANESLNVRGIPFRVKRENEVVQKLTDRRITLEGKFETIFFLGMSVENWGCSEWWGPKPYYYDSSERGFFGDILGRLRIIYDNCTQVGIPLIFGVNAFNYELYCGSHEREHLPVFDAPYNEPFKSDDNARKLLDAALVLMDNDDPEREKNTRWVFAVKLDPARTVTSIQFDRERLGGVCISAVTGLNAGEADDMAWKLNTLQDFLGKKWLTPIERLRHRMYTYLTDLPEHDPVQEIENFKMPDLRFEGSKEAEIYTNIYRKNIDDMQKYKVTEDGMPHTSSSNTVNFGCYVGFGSYTHTQSYNTQIWTRDVGRLLTELINLGEFERPILAAQQMFKCLYLPFCHEVPPHWKRVANLMSDPNRVRRDQDGTENDGHASIMMFLYTLWAKGGVDDDWIRENHKPLKDAADYILWEIAHPEESGFNRVLYSYSEASSQDYGGFDLYSNLISAAALVGFARMFRAIGEESYAGELEQASALIRKGVDEVFLCDTPDHGKVYTDTTEDCWTYEYKRFCEALMFADLYGYDIARDAPERREILVRTFMRQKEEYYEPFSGRQMGYGQGYLNNAALMLDRFDELTECMNATAAECWNGHEYNYIVPEGVILHGSGKYWFRNCDLGNGVQQAEIVKAARLMTGIDDFDMKRGVRLVPRLPLTWSGLSAENYPAHTEDGVKYISFRYERCDAPKEGMICASDGKTTYYASVQSDAKIESLRFGPFDSPDISVRGSRLTDKKQIDGRWFAYTEV